MDGMNLQGKFVFTARIPWEGTRFGTEFSFFLRLCCFELGQTHHTRLSVFSQMDLLEDGKYDWLCEQTTKVFWDKIAPA